MSGEINVIQRTQHIVVDPASSSIAIINAGPPGPNTGVPGPPGVVQSVLAGPGIAVDASTPHSPIVSVATPPAFTQVTLQNGYTHEPTQPIKYRMIGDMVYVRGRAAGTLNNVAMFTMPVGYRPGIQIVLAMPMVISGGWNVGAALISPDGQFMVMTPGLTSVGLNFIYSTTP